MGSNCPFSSEELPETLNPIFTPAERAAVREEAAASIQQGASTFTMTSTTVMLRCTIFQRLCDG